MNELVGKQLLRDRLSGASDDGLDALSSVLLPTSRPSVEPFSILLQEGCSPAAIQSVLIDQRDYLLAKEDRGAKASLEVVRHFDRLGLLLLQALTKHWQGRVSHLESRLSLANTELQLAEARSRWTKDGEVTLYNYYHEVPITARVNVHDVSETGFGVDRNDDLIHVMAADQYGRFAFIRLSDLQTCLRMEFERTVGKRVYFKYAGTFLTARERRQNVRVSCDDGLKVSLTDSSGSRIETVIYDLSQSGMGLDTRDEVTFQVGSRMEFQLSLPSGDLKGRCTVCWLRQAHAPSGRDEAGPSRFGVELDMSPSLMRKLQFEVARRKKRILNELQMLGVPDLLD